MLINTERIFQFHVRLQHWGNCSVESKFVYKNKREFIRHNQKIPSYTPYTSKPYIKIAEKETISEAFFGDTKHKLIMIYIYIIELLKWIQFFSFRVCFAILKTSRLLGKQNSCYHKDVIIYGNNSCQLLISYFSFGRS